MPEIIPTKAIPPSKLKMAKKGFTVKGKGDPGKIAVPRHCDFHNKQGKKHGQCSDHERLKQEPEHQFAALSSQEPSDAHFTSPHAGTRSGQIDIIYNSYQQYKDRYGKKESNCLYVS